MLYWIENMFSSPRKVRRKPISLEFCTGFENCNWIKTFFEQAFREMDLTVLSNWIYNRYNQFFDWLTDQQFLILKPSTVFSWNKSFFCAVFYSSVEFRILKFVFNARGYWEKGNNFAFCKPFCWILYMFLLYRRLIH